MVGRLVEEQHRGRSKKSFGKGRPARTPGACAWPAIHRDEFVGEAKPGHDEARARFRAGRVELVAASGVRAGASRSSSRRRAL